MRLRPFVAAILLLAQAAHADDQVRTVQEELRRRNVYFGDVDGRRTPELEEAMKRYQKRKRLPVRGTDDRETLESLGVVAPSPEAPPPQQLNWPEEPVLRSDAVINVNYEATRISEETGIAPEAVGAAPPPAPESTSRRRGKSPKTRGAQASTAPSAVATRTAARSSAPLPPQQPESTRRTPRRSAERTQAIEPAEIREFVSNYVKAVGRDNVEEELEFYADNVDYYQNGTIDRRIIERTLRDYYKRWPDRKYRLGRTVEYARSPRTGLIAVTFQVEFDLRSRGKKVRGQTENRFVINAATADPRIISIQEQRVRR
jgi:hypothetical protein